MSHPLVSRMGHSSGDSSGHKPHSRPTEETSTNGSVLHRRQLHEEAVRLSVVRWGMLSCGVVPNQQSAIFPYLLRRSTGLRQDIGGTETPLAGRGPETRSRW